MHKKILAGLFVALGCATIIYEAMVMRPQELQAQKKKQALLLNIKMKVNRDADGFTATPVEQVYDAMQESINPVPSAEMK